MPKYKCSNEKCSLYNKELSKSTSLRYVDGEVFDSAQICEKCGKVGEFIEEDGFCTTFHGGVNSNICNK